MVLAWQNLKASIDMIVYKINIATIDDLYQHLLKCDDNFEPPLSSRVELKEFSEKIYNLSENFEAWEDDVLVGHIGCYFNDELNKRGFINNVSILKSHSNKGIGTSLMEKCLEFGDLKKYQVIELEVFEKNLIALKLYKKFGFKQFDACRDFIKMRKKLKY